MIFQVLADVVHLAVDAHPDICCVFVLLDFRLGAAAQRQVGGRRGVRAEEGKEEAGRPEEWEQGPMPART